MKGEGAVISSVSGFFRVKKSLFRPLTQGPFRGNGTTGGRIKGTGLRVFFEIASGLNNF
jgi:hypothetical protein